MQQATCTEGPSLPTDNPEAITKGCKGTHLVFEYLWVDATYQGQGLDHERPDAKVAFHNKARKNAFDFRDSGACSVLCKGFDKVGSR